jgi:hypothetical protein
MALNIAITVFCVVMPYSLADRYLSSGGGECEDYDLLGCDAMYLLRFCGVSS